MLSLCFIIPTKDRPYELERLLQSMSEQEVFPDQIIVIDAGERNIKWLAKKFSNLPIDYYHMLPPSLTKQRNLGIKNVRDNINLIGFLDDDIVLQPLCIVNMLNFWNQAAEEIWGAGFNIVDHTLTPSQQPKLRRLFTRFKKNNNPGIILSNGRNTPYCPALKTTETKWLCGGATVWKKQIFQEVLFDEWFAGYAIMEDVDFSYRASQHYNLAVVQDAQVQHLETNTKNHYLWAYVFTMNNLYFSQKHKAFSYWKCLYSFLKDGVRYSILGMITAQKNDLLLGFGYLCASLKALSSGPIQISKQVK